MTRASNRSSRLAVLAVLLLASMGRVTPDAAAQQVPQTPPGPTTPSQPAESSGSKDGSTTLTDSPTKSLPVKLLVQGKKVPRSKRQFIANYDARWQLLTTQCNSDKISSQCATAAVVLANSECAGSGRFFQRATSTWQFLNIAMIVASAGFTAVGASSTIANAKIYSTLGGTTGLGAVTTTINSNAAGDQVGVSNVNSVIIALNALQQQSKDDTALFRSASAAAAQCVMGASATTGTNPPQEAKSGVTVSISPNSVTLAAGATQQFAATVSNATSTSVTWSATGGDVTPAGSYTAGKVAGSYKVTATSVQDSSKSANADVTIK